MTDSILTNCSAVRRPPWDASTSASIISRSPSDDVLRHSHQVWQVSPSDDVLLKWRCQACDGLDADMMLSLRCDVIRWLLTSLTRLPVLIAVNIQSCIRNSHLVIGGTALTLESRPTCEAKLTDRPARYIRSSCSVSKSIPRFSWQEFSAMTFVSLPP